MAGQRIEVPQAGVAVTVPEGWGFRIEMLETDWAQDAGVTVDAAIWRVLELWSPVGDSELATEHCSIGMLRVGEEGPEIMMMSDATPAPGRFPSGWTQSTTELHLPAGLATRIDSVGQEPEGDRYSTTYNFVSPDGPVWLGCDGLERPDGRWLSIAETIEFLPAEP